MDPRNERKLGIQDERDAQRATAATVEDQVPRPNAVAQITVDGLEPQLLEPCVHGRGLLIVQRAGRVEAVIRSDIGSPSWPLTAPRAAAAVGFLTSTVPPLGM